MFWIVMRLRKYNIWITSKCPITVLNNNSSAMPMMTGSSTNCGGLSLRSSTYNCKSVSADKGPKDEIKCIYFVHYVQQGQPYESNRTQLNKK